MARAVLLDFTIEGMTPLDGNGHMTHIAGTVAGFQSGVARQVKVFMINVLDSAGSGTSTTVTNGLSKALTHQQTNFPGQPAVYSASLSGGFSASQNDAFRAVANAGHIVTVAAGNQNANACKTSPASAGGSGATSGVITVAATDSTDSRASYSNYGTCVDIFAPGSSIPSLWKDSVTVYSSLSGTSTACPHVAGVAATLLAKNSTNRAVALQELFAKTAKDVVKNPPSASNRLLQATGNVTRTRRKP